MQYIEKSHFLEPIKRLLKRNFDAGNDVMLLPSLTVLTQSRIRALLTLLMIWLGLLCGAALFMPNQWGEALHLESLHQKLGFLLGLGLIISISYFASLLLYVMTAKLLQTVQFTQQGKKISAKLAILDAAERALLREFFLQSTNKLTLPQNEACVEALVRSYVLECVGNEQHYAIQASTADYKISAKARSQLTRQLLRLPAGNPSEDEMQQLIKARPAFVTSAMTPRKNAA